MNQSALRVHTSMGGLPLDDLTFEQNLIESAARGVASLFFYSWQEPVLVLGNKQELSSHMSASTEELGIPVLRRKTGGTGVLHDRDLNIALALPTDHPWGRGIHGLYEHFLGSIHATLSSLEVHATRSTKAVRKTKERSPICFEDHAIETLLVNGKKVLGCAQSRRRAGVLVHGTLLLGLNVPLQAQVYGVSEERIAAALGSIASADIPLDTLVTALAEQFATALHLPAAASAAPFQVPAKRPQNNDNQSID